MKKTKQVLFLIFFVALILRLFKLDIIPPSISWDEAAVGYNAYSIANFGRDEYGKVFPLYFKSFGDDKRPVHVYFSATFVKLFGLSEFSVRFSSALFGILNVALIFYLGKILFKKEEIGLIAAFLMAISPYAIQFSRFNHELNFALFFFMMALILFFLSLEKRNYLIPFSFLSFGICILSYHSSLIVVPLIIILLIIFYYKNLLVKSRYFFMGVGILSIIAILILFNKPLLGGARIKQNSLQDIDTRSMWIYQVTKNDPLSKVEFVIRQYLSHFHFKYLFISGDSNTRHSSQAVGEFYLIDSIFLLAGIFYIFQQKKKTMFLTFFWALLAPLPASLVVGAPHAARAMFMMGSWHLIAALGFYFLLSKFKNFRIRWIFLGLSGLIYTFFLISYLNYYFGQYSKKSATEWQYGMKQIVEFVKANPQYSHIFMTEERAQPYIFFLFHLQTPLPDYLNSVVFNKFKSRDYSLISYFDKYYFGGWDPIESKPDEGILYIVTPSQYGGLKYRTDFNVVEKVYYPDGSDAYFLVSKK